MVNLHPLDDSTLGVESPLEEWLTAYAGGYVTNLTNLVTKVTEPTEEVADLTGKVTYPEGNLT